MEQNFTKLNNNNNKIAVVFIRNVDLDKKLRAFIIAASEFKAIFCLFIVCIFFWN